MRTTWGYAIASVLVVSLASLIGIVTIAVSERRLRATIFVMVSLAVGAMFGDAFIHLLPESFATSGHTLRASLSILAGILVFFLLEKFLLWRHEHLPEVANTIHPVGYMNMVADGLHNLLDGVLIGASYLVSVPVGLGTTIAVLLHEIPQEIGDFGVLVHAGFSRTQALWVNFLTATLAIVGALLALGAGQAVKQFPLAVLPFTAGGFIYIAGSDLVPELHKERQPLKSLIQLVAIGLGVGVMLLLTLLE